MTSYVVGIQWLLTSVRLACFSRRGSSLQLLTLDQLIFDSEDSVSRADTVKTWITKHVPDPSNCAIALSVPESQVILSELELPDLGDKELAEAIHWEMAGKSTHTTGGQITQWKKVAVSNSTVSLSTMSMKETDITAFAAFFKHVGIPLTVIEPSGISQSRVLDIPKEPTLLVSTEGGDILVVCMRNGIAVFSTSLTIPFSAVAQKTQKYTKEVIESLAVQLRKTIAYWEEKDNLKAKHLMFTGMAAVYQGIRKELADGVHIPYEEAKRKKTAKIQTKFPDATIAAYSAAIGAAMRLVRPDSFSGMNFIPKADKEQLSRAYKKSRLVSNLLAFTYTNGVLLIILGSIWGYLQVRQAMHIRDIDQTTRFIENHPGQKYVDGIAKTNTMISRITELTATNENIGQKLAYISASTPKSVTLTGIALSTEKNQVWTIDGVGDRSDILAFYDKIIADGRAKQVRMPYSNFQKPKDSVFQIQILW